MMGVGTRSLRRYSLANIHFPGECLYLSGLLPCSGFCELSIPDITLQYLPNYPRAPSICHSISQLFLPGHQNLQHVSSFRSVISASVSEFHLHLFICMFYFSHPL